MNPATPAPSDRLHTATASRSTSNIIKVDFAALSPSRRKRGRPKKAVPVDNIVTHPLFAARGYELRGRFDYAAMVHLKMSFEAERIGWLRYMALLAYCRTQPFTRESYEVVLSGI